MKKQTAMKIARALIIVVAWFALITQLQITVSQRASSVPEMMIRYLSFFTIETNLLVAVCFTVLLLTPDSAWGRFFSKQQTITAITVYIVIVGLIYNTILRFLWVPEGIMRVVDELLHVAVPAMAFVYWLVFTAKDRLQWKNIFPWLIYPFAYITYVLIRGSISGFYPYPFINTSQLGLNKVLVNSVGIAIVFIITSLTLVAIGKAMEKPE